VDVAHTSHNAIVAPSSLATLAPASAALGRMSKSDAQQDMLCQQHNFTHINAGVRVPCRRVCISLAHSSLSGYHVRLWHPILETNSMQTSCGRPSCCPSRS
jgi:hypothetical protein